MDDKQFETINRKLDALIKVTGMAACRGLSQDEQAWVLHCAGLSLKVIGELLGSNPNAVGQAIHRMKNISKSMQPKRGGGPSEIKATETSK